MFFNRCGCNRCDRCDRCNRCNNWNNWNNCGCGCSNPFVNVNGCCSRTFVDSGF
ncbi:MAG: hypothetical protein ACI4PF_06260 [Christensenellales bacterium]